MKYLEYLIWISGILAGLIVILATIAFIFDLQILGVVHVVNFFHVVNTLLLICICSILYLIWKKKEG